MKINLEKIKKEKPLKDLLEFSVINLDKPSGPTSFQVAEMVGRIIGAKKFSHFGTLDPKVTGVLPVAINRACRLSTWFMKKNKTYVGIMRLHQDTSEEKLKEEMKKFVGKIMQMPPVKSRVKREIREREVYKWDILEKDGKDVLFVTEVEAGTYIRKLCDDLGKVIGGCHMAELRRTEAGIFSEADANFVNLYQLEEAVEEWKKGNEEKLRKMLIPGEIISEIMPVVQVKEKFLHKLWNGSPVFKEFLSEEMKENQGNIAVFSAERLIGVYKIAKEGNVVAKPEFVLRCDL
jgi:H/ACA ribonucleoprotein complex subunit 4